MRIRPYGDTLDDGSVQLSFTLPVAISAKVVEAARLFVLSHGFGSCEIVHSESLANGFTFFLAYGKSNNDIDFDKVVVEESPQLDYMSFEKINDFINKKIGRKVVVVGACTGSDAHTVCLDAIMNMKGFNHHFGLERYPMFQTYNLGAQVPNEDLIDYAKKVNADVMLISQVVTQKDVHIKNMKNFIDCLTKDGLCGKFINLVGGPKISHKLAVELGFDGGFGKGTYAEHVGTFIARRLVKGDNKM